MTSSAPVDVEKLDLAKLHKDEYAAREAPGLVRVGTAAYLAARGEGPPGGELFQARVGALYGMAYTAKFRSKLAGRDYVVGKLEGLFGVDGQTPEELASLDTARWRWRLLIRVPEFVSARDLEASRATLREKGKEGDFEVVSLEVLEEGLCVQALHVGPYAEEGRTHEAMVRFAESEGLRPHMWHHEIYLSDPRRVPPARLRTLLRRPVRAA